jgi:DNA polymerase-4
MNGSPLRGDAARGPAAAVPGERHVAHLDMDAFYASVELLRYPQLQGLPVVIGGRRQHGPESRGDGTLHFSTLRHYTGRGVITTATYPARALGLHSAMGMMKAAALAPDAILLPADFDRYRSFSRAFKAAVAEVVGTDPPLIEDRGIDEIYIELSGRPELGADHGAALARAIKARVFERTGLSCSIGVTPNKLLSKLASDLEKPGGVTILREADVPVRIWPLPARRINGIGPKAALRLDALGIRTIGELAKADAAELIARFGTSYGAWLHEAAHGRDTRPVVTYSEPKSLSRETTFEQDLHAKADREALSSVFTRLCEQVAEDLRRKGYVGKTIGLKLRYDNFKTVTRDLTLPLATADAQAIRRAAGLCLKRVPLERRLRLLGVRVGSLQRPADGAQGRTAVPTPLPGLFDS